MNRYAIIRLKIPNPSFEEGSRVRDIRVEEIFIEDGLAAINKALNIFAVVGEKEQKRQCATEAFSMLNVVVGAAINVELSCKFKL